MKIGLATSSKNEKNIIEWFNYYIKIGIDYFIIYDDLSDIPIQDVFNENNIDISKYFIFRNNDTDNIYENLNQRYIVHRAYLPNSWINLFIPKCIEKNIDYLLYVDVDEFLYLDKFKTVHEMVTEYLPVDVLKINWLFFGSNKLIENNGVNNIIDSFNKSCKYLCQGTNSLKSITKVSKISTTNAFQYGPHVLPIINNCIVKDIYNNILESYGNNLNHLTPFLRKDHDYKNNIYIAHYSCQDLTTFVKRKFTNKTNYYWWTTVLKVPNRIEVYNYVDIINDNFSEFVNYINNKINCNLNEEIESTYKNIPMKYIDGMIFLYNMFNKNDVLNNNIIDYKYS
jgi:hypothetical protein